MPLPIVITAETSGARAALTRLGNAAPLAVTRALNRTIEQVETVAIRAIAQDTGLQQKTVRKALHKTLATFDNLTATFTIRGRPLSLVALGARQTTTGVSYRVRGSQTSIPHAFLATMPSGHRGVFLRTGIFGRRNNPKLERIAERFGPSLGEVVQNQPAIIDAIAARATERFPPNLDHEISFLSRQLRLAA